MNKNQLILAYVVEQVKSLTIKDCLSIFFSLAIVILTLLMWRIRRQDFIMKKLRTSCRNFLDLCLKNWLNPLEKIITVSKVMCDNYNYPSTTIRILVAQILHKLESRQKE